MSIRFLSHERHLNKRPTIWPSDYNLALHLSLPNSHRPMYGDVGVG